MVDSSFNICSSSVASDKGILCDLNGCFLTGNPSFFFFFALAAQFSAFIFQKFMCLGMNFLCLSSLGFAQLLESLGPSHLLYLKVSSLLPLRTFKCHSCWAIGCSSSSTMSPVLPVVPTVGTTFKDTTLATLCC